MFVIDLLYDFVGMPRGGDDYDGGGDDDDDVHTKIIGFLCFLKSAFSRDLWGRRKGGAVLTIGIPTAASRAERARALQHTRTTLFQATMGVGRQGLCRARGVGRPSRRRPVGDRAAAPILCYD